MENLISDQPRKKKNRKFSAIAVTLVLALGNMFRAISRGNIRTVDLLAILGCGMLIGLFIAELASVIKKTKESGYKY